MQNTYIAHKIRAVPPTRNLNFEVSRVTAQKADFSAIEAPQADTFSAQFVTDLAPLTMVNRTRQALVQPKRRGD